MLTCIFCSTLFYNWKKAGYLFPTNFQLFLLPCCVLNSGQLLYPPTSTGENSHLGQLREFFKINFIQAKSVFIFMQFSSTLYDRVGVLDIQAYIVLLFSFSAYNHLESCKMHNPNQNSDRYGLKFCCFFIQNNL